MAVRKGQRIKAVRKAIEATRTTARAGKFRAVRAIRKRRAGGRRSTRPARIDREGQPATVAESCRI